MTRCNHWPSVLFAALLMAACAPEQPQALQRGNLVNADTIQDAVDQSSEEDTSERDAPFPGGLIGRWRFDEGQNYVAASSEGSCTTCDATLLMFPDWSNWWRLDVGGGAVKGSGWRADGTALDGQILMLDGDNDHLVVNGALDLLDGLEEFTIQARIRPCTGNSYDEQGVEQTIVSMQHLEMGLLLRGVSVQIDNSGYLGAHGPSCNNTPGNPLEPGYLAATETKVPRGQWSWITLVFDGLGTGLDAGWRFYLNDQYIGFCETTDSVTTVDHETPLVFGARKLLELPATNPSNVAYYIDTLNHFCGDFDEIRIFERALSLTEVVQTASEAPDQPTSVAALDPSCSSLTEGCADGTAEGLTNQAGIVACEYAEAVSEWATGLDEVCAEGWEVCSTGQLTAHSSNRNLEAELGNSAWLLSQSGCGNAVYKRYLEADVAAAAESCVGDFCQTLSEGEATRPMAVMPGLTTPLCWQHAFACGARTCRTVGADEPVAGVLCCKTTCASSLPFIE